MSDNKADEIAASIMIGTLMVGATVAFLALVVALVGTKDVRVKVDLNNESVYRLNDIVGFCTPSNATFEQELACYQAVFGGLTAQP